MSDEDGVRLRAGIANWRQQISDFKQRLASLTVEPPDQVQ